LPEKKFKRYAIKVEDEQDFEKLLADLHERFPNMGYLVQNANGTSIVEFYLPEDAKLPEDISQRWPIEELGYDNQQWLDDLRGKFKGVNVAGTRILPPWEEHCEHDLLSIQAWHLEPENTRAHNWLWFFLVFFHCREKAFLTLEREAVY